MQSQEVKAVYATIADRQRGQLTYLHARRDTDKDSKVNQLTQMRIYGWATEWGSCCL